VPVDDPLLPAARHLAGADATDLLKVAVASFGGTLAHADAVQVQHRPGHDLVVRYDADVAWGDGPARRETLLAAATTHGAPAGTLVLMADDLEAGVWRYPFDPRLPGLSDAVTPGRVDRLLGDVLGGRPRLEVVAYRPIRRAVVRATTGDRAVYLKVVRPEETRPIANRHRQLRAAGIPVPEVLDADETKGILMLAALPGENLRDRLLDHATGWPRPAEYVDLMRAVASVALSGASVPGPPPMAPAEVAAAHARALLAILPGEADRLHRIATSLETLSEAAPTTTIHGDLYEAQLMVDGGGALTGLLDLDDAGPGPVLADAATLLAHLHILQPATRRHRDHLRRYRIALRAALLDAFAEGGDPAELDGRTAATLLGLATGPFRAQRSRWQTEVRRRLAMADRLAGEKTLRKAL
jgi:Ser/Thr protein kinase RdoA (MazF antagonist)